MEQLNKQHVKSGPVTRKLGAVAETHGFYSIQPHEVTGGRRHVGATAAGSFQDCACKTDKNAGLEGRVTHDEETSHHGEEMTASSEDLGFMWKAFVSSTASAKR